MLTWILVVLVSGFTAVFASLLTDSAASGIGAFIVLVILAGVGGYLFGPRVVSRIYPPAPPSADEDDEHS